LLAGGGLIGIASSNKVLGNDFDTAAHFGVGVKGYITKNLALRLDGRGTVAQGYGKNELALHWEGLLGASVVLGRPEPPPPPPDSDGDGVIDSRDQCPQLAGVPPLGCPPPPPDGDGDGVPDAEDRCPDVAGVASSNPEKNGCPLPPPDSDSDGVPDADDKCPNVVGDGPDGCLQDTDGDRIPNRDDKCPDQPETRNGFEDEDGCPDELPQAVKKFTGAIKGIVFESGKATIRKESFPTLDAAVRVLAEYQALRMEISGHTDSTGTAERNTVLSKERAEAVKLYLTGRGIAPERIETRGAGPNEPVADNSTKEGRTMNRRIEFKLIQKPDATDAAAPAPAPAPDAPPAPAALPTPAPQTGAPASMPQTAGPTPAPPATAPQATPPAAAPREAPVPKAGSPLQPAPAPAAPR
jgi:OOP family OmpA-OmpF porin